jgi:glycosyltransferase involved in cell wall biosynthesis
MNTRLQISVVVATYNRAETLRETIRHLADQKLSADQYEVIVVDDGSSDNTRQVVEEAAAGVSFPLKYLGHPNRGPGYTQNRGIREARAPIVLLIADDIFLTPRALEAHLDAHTRNPQEEAAVLGRVLQSPSLHQSVFLRVWDPWGFRFSRDHNELPYYMFWACNISFKRDFMLRRGMFREQMGRAGPAAHEDVELGYRLSQHGLRILYSKEALGYHHHIETWQGTIRRFVQRGLNWPEFRELVPEPEIPVVYRVLNRDTLRDHWRALTGSRRQYLIGTERSLVLMSLRYALRSLLFNRVTVPCLWLPLLRHADRNRLLARLMISRFYRGVFTFHFSRAAATAKLQTDCRPPAGIP